MRYMVEVEDRTFVVEVQQGTITIDDQVHSVDLRHIEPLSLYSLLIDNISHEVFIEKRESQYAAMLRGKLYSAQVHDLEAWERDVSRAAHPIAGAEGLIKAPMPGLIVEVEVSEGNAVTKGAGLIIVEAMKMENELKSPADGVVKKVHVKKGDTVEQNQVLIIIEQNI